MKIFIANDYDGLYGRFWGELGDIVTDVRSLMAEPESFGLVCFTGGEDVSPALYGHQNLRSHCAAERDKRETLIFEVARKYEIPMTGICRGSQFLNVMCGGTMVQHLKRDHGGSPHGCLTSDNGESLFAVTSSHHQMSVLGPGGVLLGWAEAPMTLESMVYDGDLYTTLSDALVKAGNLEHLGDNYAWVTEAFSYPAQKIFAVQHHPEWQDLDKEAPQWTLAKIREICLRETTTVATS